MVVGQRCASCGFSLVELMLALALGMIVIAGMAQLFRGTGQGHASLERMARAGESGRYALAILGHSARHAGFLGCAGRSGRLVNTLNGDLDALFEANLGKAVQAYDNDGDGSAAAYAATAGIEPGRIVSGTDMLTFRRLESPLLRVSAPVDASPVVERTGEFNLKAGDFLLIGDCEQSSLFRLTGVVPGDRRVVLLREPGTESYENASAKVLSGIATAYGPEGPAGGATVGRVLTETYFIARGRGTGRRGEPLNSLWRRTGTAASAELVEGVHDLQARFGVDARPGDGVAAVSRYVGIDDLPAGGIVRSVEVRVAAGDGAGPRAFGQTFSLRNAG